MLKLSDTTNNNNNNNNSKTSSSSVEQVGNDDNKLSLLVKAAEKLKRDEASTKEINTIGKTFNESNNFNTLTAFLNLASVTSVTSSALPNSLQSNQTCDIKPDNNNNNNNNNNNINNNDSNIDPANNNNIMFIGKNGKPTRPFKAYPKEPLSLPLGGCNQMINIPLNNNLINNNTRTISPTNLLNTNSNTDVNVKVKENSLPINNNNSQNLIFSTLSAITSALNNTLNSVNLPAPTSAITPEYLIELLAMALIQQQQQQQSSSPQSPTLKSPDKMDKSTEQTLQHTTTPLTAVIGQSTPLQSHSSITSSILTGNSNTNIINSLINNTTSDIISSVDNISALAFSANDFCTQYRKRINQAQERLLQKQKQAFNIATLNRDPVDSIINNPNIDYSISELISSRKSPLSKRRVTASDVEPSDANCNLNAISKDVTSSVITVVTGDSGNLIFNQF
jgi:hypothetical protein